MPAADLAPLQSQQASQHTRTGEGILQVQPIETLHDRQIGGRYRARLIINAAAADLQNFRLPGDRQIVLTVDHRFALSNPALVSAPSKKSFSSVSSPILACSDFTSTAGVAGVPPPSSENIGGAALKLRFPSRDLIGVNVEMLGQLGYRPIALDGGQRQLRLEGR